MSVSVGVVPRAFIASEDPTSSPIRKKRAVPTTFQPRSYAFVVSADIRLQ
jgi:hypothetical protein